MAKRIFDRAIRFDKKSVEYPIRALLPANKEPRTKSWAYVQLDQGKEGACAGFSATMEAAARPVPVFGSPIFYKSFKKSVEPVNQVALEIYHRAKELDEWAGEDYSGTSVLGAVKAGTEKGWWKEYRWALGPGAEAAAQDVIMSLSYHGPVMMGTYWYAGMYDADANGYLNATGKKVGGHAWLLTAYDKEKDAVWTPNSWGGAGQGWITRADLVKLLANDGEACIPVLRTKPK
jgi:hypothetical protein